jgi:hypothetical protein
MTLGNEKSFHDSSFYFKKVKYRYSIFLSVIWTFQGLLNSFGIKGCQEGQISKESLKKGMFKKHNKGNQLKFR